MRPRFPTRARANLWVDSNSGVDLGDSGLGINNNTGAFSEFKFLDTGTSYPVGECSRKLCRTLAPTSDDVIYVPNEDPEKLHRVPQLQRPGPGVGDGLAKLAAADNSDELLLFLALGAHFAFASRPGSGGFYAQPDSPRVRLPNEYFNIMMALSAKGYPVDQIPFHAVEQSINLS